MTTIYILSGSNEILQEQLAEEEPGTEVLQSSDNELVSPRALIENVQHKIQRADAVLGMISERSGSYAAAREHEYTSTLDDTPVVIWKPRGDNLGRWRAAGTDYISPSFGGCIEYIEEYVEQREAEQALGEASETSFGIDHPTTNVE